MPASGKARPRSAEHGNPAWRFRIALVLAGVAALLGFCAVGSPAAGRRTRKRVDGPGDPPAAEAHGPLGPSPAEHLLDLRPQPDRSGGAAGRLLPAGCARPPGAICAAALLPRRAAAGVGDRQRHRRPLHAVLARSRGEDRRSTAVLGQREPVSLLRERRRITRIDVEYVLRKRGAGCVPGRHKASNGAVQILTFARGSPDAAANRLPFRGTRPVRFKRGGAVAERVRHTRGRGGTAALVDIGASTVLINSSLRLAHRRDARTTQIQALVSHLRG